MSERARKAGQFAGAVERLAVELAMVEIIQARRFLGKPTSKKDREELLKLTTPRACLGSPGTRSRRTPSATDGDSGVHSGPHRTAESRAGAPGRAASVLRGEVMPTKKKRLTQREKAERAAMKKQLQAEGVLPPDKPRLNRKKFARETWAEWEEFLKSDPIRAEVSLLRAVEFIAGPELPAVTPEQVGVYKALKLAVEYNKFLRKLEAEGRSKYTIGELADEVVLPIWKL